MNIDELKRENAELKQLLKESIENFRTKELADRIYKMPGEISVVGGPGEKGGIVLFKSPYRKFEGYHSIYCATNMESKRNRYTPENEKEIINNNIRILYQEMIVIEYQDCRRKMRGAEIGGEIHWFPINPGSNGDIWNREICNRLDK